MAKRGLKIFGIGLGTLILVGAVVVGILILTGTIRNPLKENLTNQICIVPTVTNVEIIDANGTMRISYSPGIEQGCIQGPLWEWSIDGSETTCGGSGGVFTPVPGQSYIDVQGPPKPNAAPNGGPCEWTVYLSLLPTGKSSNTYQNSNMFKFRY